MLLRYGKVNLQNIQNIFQQAQSRFHFHYNFRPPPGRDESPLLGAHTGVAGLVFTGPPFRRVPA